MILMYMTKLKIPYSFKDVPLDDPKVWDLICSGDTTGIFQLESQLGKDWSKKVKPRSIEELAALTAILRPACLESGTAEQYVKSKIEGIRPELPHESLYEILKDTYYSFLFQEQSIRIGRELAGMSEADADKYIRKGIGKKRQDIIAECRKVFLDGCKKVGILNEEQAEQVFVWIQSSSRYQFNKCLTEDANVYTTTGHKTIRELKIGDKVLGLNDDWREEFITVKDVINNGQQEIVGVRLKSGKTIKCTINHKFLCDDMVVRPLYRILSENPNIMCQSGINKATMIHSDSIKSIEFLGKQYTLNIEIDSKNHLYYANGIVNQNSHSVAYGLVAYFTAYAKCHYPAEFYTSWLTYSKYKIKPREEIYGLVQNARINHVEVLPPDIKIGNIDFKKLNDKEILFGISHIRGVGEKSIKNLEKFNLDSFDKFLLHVKDLKRNVCESLIKSGSCDRYGLSRKYMLRCLYIIFGQSDKINTSADQDLRSLTQRELKYFLEKFRESKDIEGSLQKVIDDKFCVTNRIRVIESKIKVLSYKNIEDTNTQNAIWEKLYLGLPLTCSIADDYDYLTSNVKSCREVFFAEPKSKFTIHVVIDKIREKETGPKAKNPGQKYCYLEVSDNSGALQGVVCWPNTYEQIRGSIFENSVVEISGRKDVWKNREQIVSDLIKIIG